MKNRYILIGLASLVIASPFLILIVYQNLHNDTSRDGLLTETAKAFLQLVGVAIIGGAIKLLYDDITEQRRQAEKIREQERTMQAATNDIRKELLNDLIYARSGVEEARIRYRIEESLSPVEQYKETILKILKARLTLSRIWNAIETSSYLFSQAEEIKKNINRMKVYLDDLIAEYEKVIKDLRQLSEAETIKYLRNLKVFGDYVSGEIQTNYGERFLVGSYRPAVSEIRKEVLLARELFQPEDSTGGPKVLVP